MSRSHAHSCACSNIFQIIEKALCNPNDGLKDVEKFSPGTFDKILLDPPCSALGLRPKLFVTQRNIKEVTKHASYQIKFVNQTVSLLKPGGLMTYSTCTMSSAENEGVVAQLLVDHPSMELVALPGPAPVHLGKPGLAGCGLSERERMLVRRFDPGDASSQDTMGFFIALLRKRHEHTK